MPGTDRGVIVSRRSVTEYITVIWSVYALVVSGQWLVLCARDHAPFWLSTITVPQLALSVLALYLVRRGRRVRGDLVTLTVAVSTAIAVALLAAYPSLQTSSRSVVFDGLLFLSTPGCLAYAALARRWRLVAPAAALTVQAVLLAVRSSATIPIEQGASELANLVIVVGMVAALRGGARVADQYSTQVAEAEQARRAREARQGFGVRANATLHNAVIHDLDEAASALDSAEPDRAHLKLRSAIDSLRLEPAPSAGPTALCPIVAQYCQDILTVDVHVVCEREVTVDSEQLPAFLDAFASALRNVQRHSRATKVEVSVTGSADSVSVELRDDGIGFDQTAQRRRDGLNLLHQSMHLIDGRVDIVSARGEGTRVRLTWPSRADHDPDAMRDQSGWGWVSGLHIKASRIWGFLIAPQLLVNIGFSLVHPLTNVVVQVITIAVQLALSVVVARRIALFSLTRLQAAGLGLVSTAILFLGLSAVDGKQADGYAFWVSSGAIAAVACIGFLRPYWESLSWFAITIGVLIVLMRSSAAGTLGAIAAMTIGFLLAILSRIGLRVLDRLAHAALVADRNERAHPAIRDAQREIERGRLEPVGTKLMGLLGDLDAFIASTPAMDTAALAAARDTARQQLRQRTRAYRDWARVRLQLRRSTVGEFDELYLRAVTNGVDLKVVLEATSISERLTSAVTSALSVVLGDPAVTSVAVAQNRIDEPASVRVFGAEGEDLSQVAATLATLGDVERYPGGLVVRLATDGSTGRHHGGPLN